MSRSNACWIITQGARKNKFTLPPTESPTLLRLLAQEGISEVTLFPGFDYVARKIKEEQYWDDYDSWDLF